MKREYKDREEFVADLCNELTDLWSAFSCALSKGKFKVYDKETDELFRKLRKRLGEKKIKK